MSGRQEGGLAAGRRGEEQRRTPSCENTNLHDTVMIRVHTPLSNTGMGVSKWTAIIFISI